MQYCPVLIKLTEITKKYYGDCNYLLQVWDDDNQKVYEVPLQSMITVWSICFNYLIYKPQLPDANSDSFVLVNLQKGGTETAVKNFTPDSSYKYIAYMNDALYVANKEQIYILNDPLNYDYYDASKISIIKLGSADIKIHGFFLTSDDKSNQSSLMIALETIDNQIDLNIMTLLAPLGSPNFDYQLRQYRPVVPRTAISQKVVKDSIKEFKMIFNKNGVQIGVAMKESGRVDFYYDGMLCINNQNDDALQVQDIEITFEDTYLVLQSNQEVRVVSHDLHSRQSLTQSKADSSIDKQKFRNIFTQRIKDNCKLFTRFVFLKTYIFVAHGNLLSLFDILKRRFLKESIEFQDDIFEVFRSKQTENNDFVIWILLKNGDLEYLSPKMIRDPMNPREEIEVYEKQSDEQLNVGGKILQFDQDTDENEWTFIVVAEEKNNCRLVCLHDQKLHYNLENKFTDENKESIMIDENTNFVFIFSPKENSEVLIHQNDKLYVYELQCDEFNNPVVIPLEFRKNTWIDYAGKQKEVPFIEGSSLHSVVRVKEDDGLMILVDDTYFYVMNLRNMDEIPSKFKQMCIGIFVSDHNFMYTLSQKNPETNTDSGFRLYDIENCISQVNRRNKALKVQNSQAGGDVADMDVQQDSSAQSNGVNDQLLLNMKELMSYQLSSVQVGCQGIIDFSHQNQRLVYQSSFDQLDIVPVLHRNTISFVGMDERDQYLATKVLDDKFIALNRVNQLTTWSILTGKVLEANFNLQNVDYSNFEVYSFSENHTAYYQDWATKILLKSIRPLPNQESIDPRDYFDTKNLGGNIKNQTTFLEHKQKVYYEFRLIEIVDPYTVKEHCSFIFPFYDIDKFQHLLFNDQGNMMFERLKNARSFLYQIEKAPKPNQPTFVKWKLIRRFTQFPSDLLQCTSSPYIFSPDFSRYIDIDRKAQQFILRDSRTQDIIWRIEDYVMNCKDEDYRIVAARMRWLDNTTLKYVNNEGIERKIDMTTKVCEEIQFNVIPLFQEFQQIRDKAKHFYFEKLQIFDTDSLTRLKLKYQAYKSAQLLDQKKRKESLYNQLFTVDYSLDNYRGKFVADLSFSFLYWNLIEKLESGQIQIDQIDANQFTKLIYNILPGGETIFHRLARNQRGPLIVQIAQKCHPNIDRLPIPPIETHMPFLDSIKEDSDDSLGDNFIELLEQKGDYRTINQLLLYLAAYEIDHHSRSIVKSLPTLIGKELMNLTLYFNSRLKQTAQCLKYTKGKLNPLKDPQGVTVAKYCLSNELEKILTNDPKVEENELKIQYFDVAMVHQFDNSICDEFYSALGHTADMTIFENKGIQMLIQYRWPFVREYVQKRLFIPFLIFLISVSWFMSTIYMYRLETDQNLILVYYTSMGIIMLESVYFLSIEIYQFSKNKEEYFLSLWNYFDFIPPILLMIFCPLAIMGIFDIAAEDGSIVYLNLETTMQATINLLIWLKFLYFLRIFQGTGYLIKTIIAVVLDMRYFLLILLLTMVAFGDSFRAISTSNLPQNMFIESWWGSFTYVYRMILGDFSTEVTVLQGGPELSKNYSSAGNGFGKLAPFYCWALFYLCSVLNMIIMMNLLVAIISDSFSKINQLREQANYQEKCDIIAENTYLIPSGRKVGQSNRYLLVATDKKQELGQQVRDVNFLVKDTHRKIAESQAQMERRLVEQIEALKLRNERFIVQRLEKIGGETSEIIKMLRKEVPGKQGAADEEDDNQLQF